MTALAEGIPNSPEVPMEYISYLKGAIIEKVSDLNDVKTLNYIHTMLMTAVTAETQTASC